MTGSARSTSGEAPTSTEPNETACFYQRRFLFAINRAPMGGPQPAGWALRRRLVQHLRPRRQT